MFEYLRNRIFGPAGSAISDVIDSLRQASTNLSQQRAAAQQAAASASAVQAAAAGAATQAGAAAAATPSFSSALRDVVQQKMQQANPNAQIQHPLTEYFLGQTGKVLPALGVAAGGFAVSGMFGGPGLSSLAGLSIPTAAYFVSEAVNPRNRGAALASAAFAGLAAFGTPILTKDIEERTRTGPGSLFGPGILASAGYGVFKSMKARGLGSALLSGSLNTLAAPFVAARRLGRGMLGHAGTATSPSKSTSRVGAYISRSVSNIRPALEFGAGTLGIGAAFGVVNYMNTGNFFGRPVGNYGSPRRPGQQFLLY